MPKNLPPQGITLSGSQLDSIAAGDLTVIMPKDWYFDGNEWTTMGKQVGVMTGVELKAFLEKQRSLNSAHWFS